MALFLGDMHWSIFRDKGHHVYNFEMLPKPEREKIYREFFGAIFVHFYKLGVISK